MADHQRVYPAAADEEKSMRPTAPLAPKASFSSENGDPRAYDSNRRAAAMPAQQPPAPRYFSKPPPRRNPCCCCLGWLFSFLFLVISIVAVAALVIFLVFQPRIPKYSVEGIRITNFEPNLADSSVSSQFVVEIRARNPNKKIGIYYKEDSHLAVSYTGTELCSGKLPAFYQGHKNTTVLEVTLTGTNVHLSTQLLSTLQTQQQESSIPLNIKADVPVKIKMGSWKSWKVTFHVRCRLTVDSLSSTKTVSIKSKHCKVKVKV